MKNKEEIAIYNRKYRKENIERIRIIKNKATKKYNKKNKERLAMERKEYRKENKEKVLKSEKEYREKNIERIRTRASKVAKKHRDILCDSYIKNIIHQQFNTPTDQIILDIIIAKRNQILLHRTMRKAQKVLNEN
jgi:hypothetical protein